MMNYPLPKETQTAYHAHRNQVPQNAGLIFDRFIPNLCKIREKDKGKEKGKTLQTVANIVHKKSDTELLFAWQTRWETVVGERHAVPFPLKTDWRLIAGLGAKGPLEVGFTFNRYGFPIIPGSSLKGLARAWGLYQIAEKLGVSSKLWSELEQLLLVEDTADKKTLQGKLGKLLENEALPDDAVIRQQGLVAAGALPQQWIDIFGNQDRAGLVIFFEAIPTQMPTLKLDVMTPHFSKYYQNPDKKPPTDSDNPIPIPFLTIAPGTEFRFAIGWRGDKADESLRKVAEDWLKAGLTELGVGAKTSAGYGYFQPEQDAKPAATQQTAPKPKIRPEPVWHTGVIRKIDPSRTHRGTVVDSKTKQEYSFPVSVIRGNTPGKKARVKFALLDGKVVELKRL